MANQVIELAIFPPLELRVAYAFAGSLQFHQDKKNPVIGIMVGFAFAAPGLLLAIAINSFGHGDNPYEKAFLSRNERVSYAAIALVFMLVMAFLG
jgi:hypothetical protein